MRRNAIRIGTNIPIFTDKPMFFGKKYGYLRLVKLTIYF